MNHPVALSTYSWPTFEYPLCTLGVPLADLCSQLGLSPISFNEPGLGLGSACLCDLDAELVVMLEEYVHAREHLNSKGPTVYIDAAVLVASGIDESVKGVIARLGLLPQQVVWRQSAEGQEEAIRQLKARAV